MSFRSLFHRSPPRHNVRRANHGHARRQAWFETLEDRCLLSLTPAVGYGVGSEPQAVMAADFNNDGRLDLAIANVGSDNVSVLLGSANGTFGAAIGSPAGDSPKSIAVGDFDDDGNLDLAAVNGRYYGLYAEGFVNVMFGNGNGSFQPPSSFGLNLYYSESQSVAVGDFNGDGTMDLAAAGRLGFYHYGQASVLLSNGDRTFEEPKIAVDYLANPARSMVVADFNDDGYQDLVVGTVDGGQVVRVMLGDGAGNFVNPDDWTNWLIDHGTSMVAGDVNGDGDTDLVTADGNDVNVRLGDGLGGFEPPPGGQSYPAGDEPSGVVLGDFDRDGKLDVATANYDNNDVSILRGRGDGSFAPPEHFAAGLGAYAVAAGDFNGDGWLDVATANAGGNSVSVLLNDRAGGVAVLPGDYNGNQIVDAADYTVWRDSLGRSDLLPYGGADGSGNGIVGPEDYDVWKSHFGQTLPPPVAGSDATVTEVNTATDNTTSTLALSKADPLDVPVHDDTAEISATAGSGNTAKSGDVVIPAGQTGRTFAVAHSAANDQPTKKSYRTVHGKAKPTNGGYIAKTGALTCAAGETTKTTTIEVKADNRKEADETFYLDLFDDSSNSLFTRFRGIGTVLDDDK